MMLMLWSIFSLWVRRMKRHTRFKGLNLCEKNTIMNAEASHWLCRARGGAGLWQGFIKQSSGQSYKYIKTTTNLKNWDELSGTTKAAPVRSHTLNQRRLDKKRPSERKYSWISFKQSALWISSFSVTPNHHKPHFPNTIRLHTSGRGRYVHRWRTPLIKVKQCFSCIGDFT